VRECEVGIETSEAIDGFDASVCRAVIDDPEDTARIVIGRACHHLLDQPVKRRDTILRFTAPKDSGVVNIQRGNVRPGAETEVLVFDAHGRSRPAVLSGMLAAAGLNTRLFIGGDDEFIVFKSHPLPFTGIQIQHAASLGREIGIARKNPAAVIPGSSASSCSQRQSVLPLTDATRPVC